MGYLVTLSANEADQPTNRGVFFYMDSFMKRMIFGVVQAIKKQLNLKLRHILCLNTFKDLFNSTSHIITKQINGIRHIWIDYTAVSKDWDSEISTKKDTIYRYFKELVEAKVLQKVVLYDYRGRVSYYAPAANYAKLLGETTAKLYKPTPQNPKSPLRNHGKKGKEIYEPLKVLHTKSALKIQKKHSKEYINYYHTKTQEAQKKGIVDTFANYFYTLLTNDTDHFYSIQKEKKQTLQDENKKLLQEQKVRKAIKQEREEGVSQRLEADKKAKELFAMLLKKEQEDILRKGKQKMPFATNLMIITNHFASQNL